MNKKSKIIKFKKLTSNPSQTHNYVGFHFQNTKAKKGEEINQSKQTKNFQFNMIHEEEMKEIQKEEHYKVPVMKEQKREAQKKQEMSKDPQKATQEVYGNDEIQFLFSDAEEYPLSSYKKKGETPILSFPKGYKIGEPIQDLKKQIIQNLSRTQPIIRIDEIFSTQLMRNVLGMFYDEEKSLNFINNEEKVQNEQQNHHQEKQLGEQQSGSLHYNHHNTQIFDAIQMDDEDEQNWDPQTQIWPFNQQNQRFMQNAGNHHQFPLNQVPNIHKGTQFYFQPQNQFLQQVNLSSFPMDFDL